MKLPIELFLATTGWTFTGGASASVNQHPQYCADNQPSSLIFYFPGVIGASATKIVNIDITGYIELSLSDWSRNLKWKTKTDAAYTIDFGGGHIFYLPTHQDFTDVTIGINGWTTITQIVITALTTSVDYLCLSNLVAIKDEYPADVFDGIKQGLLNAAAILAPNGIPTGAVTCLAGDKGITLSALDYIDRMAVLYISDGSNSETHQIERYDDGIIYFTSRFDGSSMKYAHTAAQVYISISIDYGVAEKEAAIPGITIWGFAPNPFQNKNDVYSIFDSFGVDGSVAERRAIFMQSYPILIDCEARHGYILAMLSRIVRWFESQNVVWINGRRHDVSYSDPPVVVDPDQSIEVFPKVQYTLHVEVHEEREKRIFWPSLASRNITYHVQNGGVLPQEGP